MGFHIRLSKEDFKFSCAHFAIFGPSCGERLHGHNYYVGFEFELDSLSCDLGFAIEFNELKPLLKKACKKLDEFILIPKASKYLKIQEKGNQVEIFFHKKFYSFPKEDVLFLEVKNISCEELSFYLWKEVKNLLPSSYKEKLIRIGVEVQETKGQRALYEGELK